MKPAHLYIDGCSICQLHCPRCPATEMGYESSIGKGYLRFADFHDLIERNPFIRRVEFDTIGEIFLNPELLRIIEYAFKKGIEVSCNTGANLNTADPAVLEGLVKYRFHALTCSLDGVTNETYRRYRVGGDIDVVISNIKRINRYKQKYSSHFPFLKWQFIVFGYNEHELPAARKMAADLGMEFYPKMSWDEQFSPVKDREFVLAQTGWPALSRRELGEKTGQLYERSVCYSLWYSPRVNWDGRLLGCCWNVWSEFGGNVFSDGYLSCISNEKICYARQMLLGKAPARKDIPCSRCEIFKEICKSGKFLTGREVWSYLAMHSSAAYSIYRHAEFPAVKKILKRLRILSTG